MSLFDSSAPGITVLTDVPFPATIISGPGISIEKQDPTAWMMTLDYAPLFEETALTPAANFYVAALDSSTGNYDKINLANLINQIQTIDQRSGIGDVNYSVATSDRYVALDASLTAVRNLTLPPASNVTAGHAISFQDEVGGLSNAHYWIIHTSGSDTLNGASNRILSRPYAGLTLWCDGVSKWTLNRLTGMSAPTTNYVMTPDDTSVGFGTLSGPVTATLPLAASVPPGKSVTVVDLLGTCSSSNTITVARSGSDTINGVPAPLAATLNAPYFFITLQSDGVSRWAITGGGTAAATTTIVSTQISDSSAVGRAVLTAPNAAAAQTVIGATAVGASVFTAASTGAAQTAIGAGTTGAAVFVAATPAAAQTALGLGSMATQAASNVNITGGTIAGAQLNNDTIVGGTIDNTAIGGTTPAAGHFTNLNANAMNGTAITGGTIDNTVIGATTPAAVTMTSQNGGQLAGLRNLIINGDMRVDQRNSAAGMVPALGNTYTADRWYAGLGVGGKLSFQRMADATSPGSGYCLNCVASTPYTPAAGEVFALRQSLEGLDIAALRWGTANALPVTLSLKILASVAGNISLAVRNGATNRSYVALVPVTTAWGSVSVTIPGDTTGTWASDNTAGLTVSLDLGTGSTFNAPSANAWNAGNYFRLAGQTLNLVSGALNASLTIKDVQLEPGTVATPFERRPIGTEMALCQRYYQSATVYGLLTAAAAAYVVAPGTLTPMRAPPSVVNQATLGTDINIGAVTIDTFTTTGFRAYATAPAAGQSNFSRLVSVQAEL
jgi:hypothetical protein